MASILVNSLKRLYNNGKGRITKGQVVERVEKGMITVEDYEAIIGESYEGVASEESGIE